VRKSCGLWDLRQNFCLYLVTTPIQLGGRGHTVNQSVAHISVFAVILECGVHVYPERVGPLIAPTYVQAPQCLDFSMSPCHNFPLSDTSCDCLPFRPCGSMYSASQSQYYSLFSSPQSSSVSNNRPSLGW
jgi:hypothetical protein